jgi:hypothetical protein
MDFSSDVLNSTQQCTSQRGPPPPQLCLLQCEAENVPRGPKPPTLAPLFDGAEFESPIEIESFVSIPNELCFIGVVNVISTQTSANY